MRQSGDEVGDSTDRGSVPGQQHSMDLPFSILRPGTSQCDADLVVVGDTGVDLVVQVGQFPRREGKVIGRHVGVFGGGMGANFTSAAQAAYPDGRVMLVSRVGDDPYGSACLSDLRARDVDTTRICIERGGLTWWCAVALDQSGEKALLGGRTSASLPHREDIEHALDVSARWVHVLGDIECAVDVLTSARASGALTSVGLEGSFVSEHPERAQVLMRSADMTVTNAAGLHVLTTDDDIETAAYTATRQSALLATLGTQGSIVATAEGTMSLPAPAVRRVVDTTGAGDSFAGTFIGRVLAGDDLLAALSSATAAAGQTIKHFGARAGPPLFSAGSIPAFECSRENVP